MCCFWYISQFVVFFMTTLKHVPNKVSPVWEDLCWRTAPWWWYCHFLRLHSSTEKVHCIGCTPPSSYLSLVFSGGLFQAGCEQKPSTALCNIPRINVLRCCVWKTSNLRLIPHNKASSQHDSSTVVGVCSTALVCSYCASVWVRIVCLAVIHISFYSDHTSSFISHLSSSVAVVFSTLDIAADRSFVQIKDHLIWSRIKEVTGLKIKVPEFKSSCDLM